MNPDDSVDLRLTAFQKEMIDLPWAACHFGAQVHFEPNTRRNALFAIEEERGLSRLDLAAFASQSVSVERDFRVSHLKALNGDDAIQSACRTAVQTFLMTKQKAAHRYPEKALLCSSR